jgi:hypothetical protein
MLAVEASSTSGWLHTDGRWIKDEQGNTIRLQGVNTYIHVQNEQSKFEAFKKYGFDTVRLALLKYDIEHPSYGDTNRDRSGVTAIDKAVNWSRDLGLRIILDQHLWGEYGGQEECWPAPGKFLSDTTLQQEWLNMWRLLVDRYKDNPTVVGIDLMNEPWQMASSSFCPGSKGVSVANPASVWEDIAKKAVADLKTHNPNLLFIVEDWRFTSRWSDVAFLKQPNIVWSDHIYYSDAKNWLDWGQAYASGDLARGKQLLAKWIDINYMTYINQDVAYWEGEVGFLTSDPYWRQQMTDELDLFDQRAIGNSAFVFGVRDWNEPYDLVDYSQPTYQALTTVGQIFSSMTTYAVTLYTDPSSLAITADGVTKTDGTNGSYTSGARIHVVAAPRSGYSFLNWETSGVSVDSSYSADTYMTVSNNGWMKAHFISSQLAVTKAATFNAIMISHDVPVSMVAGQTYTFYITVQNTGTTPWTAASNFEPSFAVDQSTFGPARVLLDPPASVAPGQQYTFTFTMTAPDAQGTYIMRCQMFQELLGGFGQALTVSIVVATQ